MVPTFGFSAGTCSLLGLKRTNTTDEYCCHAATAACDNAYSFDWNLVERLERLKWRLDEIDMSQIDRVEIDHLMASLLERGLARANHK